MGDAGCQCGEKGGMGSLKGIFSSFGIHPFIASEGEVPLIICLILRP